MVQASNEPSRATYVETRGGMKYYHSEKPQPHKGWYWSYEKQGYFRYNDWLTPLSEMNIVEI